MDIRISKSLYIRGLQCSKSLYLEKHHLGVKALSDKGMGLFDNGKLVGETARGLFPGGVLIPWIPGEDGQSEQVRLTQDAIASGITTIYEAAFLSGKNFTKIDVMEKDEEGSGWNVYEVKSGTTADGTYLEDVAYQYHVVTGAGLTVSKAYLIYVNNAYVRQGALSLRGLFKCEDVTKLAQERQIFVTEELERQRSTLAGEMPVQGIGKHCTTPNECDYKGHCWQHIPQDSVFDLKGNGINKEDLYNKGIIKQSDIPQEILKKMNAKQRQQVEATLKKENNYNETTIKTFLDSLRFPLCFFDVETFVCPIPLFDEMKPYQQIAFQYSLHILDDSGNMRHHEFLAEPGIDPRKSFIESVVRDMPADGCVVAYNKSFETGVLQGLAKLFPQYDILITGWIKGMIDLMVPFRQRDLYFWRMKGSYSIKYVLPALCPQLSYADFEIANGYAAMEAYHVMCAIKDDVEGLAKIRANLLKYCHLDTFAMVSIVKAIRVLVEKGLKGFEEVPAQLVSTTNDPTSGLRLI